MAATRAGAASGPTLRAEADAAATRGATLRATAHGALLDLYAAQSALDRAVAQQASLEARAATLAAAAASVRRRTGLLRRSARAARARVDETLRRLYVEGDVDPVAVIFGSTSLEAALEGLDGLNRAARGQRRLADDLRLASGRLERVRVLLSARRRALRAARLQAASASASLAQAVADRQATLASIRRRVALTERQVTRLQARAREASAVAARLEATAPPERVEAAAPVAGDAPVAASILPAAPGATRTLLVDAVAYYLPGRTASGLPVGPGVIAVDPRVIPLGTRVYVPGYGPAVAADVGSAVVGNIIDLWMPSTARARAWGRRTVSITVYG